MSYEERFADEEMFPPLTERTGDSYLDELLHSSERLSDRCVRCRAQLAPEWMTLVSEDLIQSYLPDVQALFGLYPQEFDLSHFVDMEDFDKVLVGEESGAPPGGFPAERVCRACLTEEEVASLHAAFRIEGLPDAGRPIGENDPFTQ